MSFNILAKRICRKILVLSYNALPVNTEYINISVTEILYNTISVT